MYLQTKPSANGSGRDGQYGLAGSNMKNVAARSQLPWQAPSFRSEGSECTRSNDDPAMLISVSAKG